MFGDRRPKGFAPGAKLNRLQGRVLLEAGFVPGYPLFSMPSRCEADDLQLIVHALTLPRQGEYGAPVTQQRPIMPVALLVPDGSDYGQTRLMPVKISEIRRAWGKLQTYWYLTGSLNDRDPEQRWVIDRKRVGSCQMHVLLSDSEAYLQLVPLDTSGRRLGTVSGDDLRWGDLSSRTHPPTTAV